MVRRVADKPAGAHRTKGEKANKKQMACIGCVYSVDEHQRTPEQLVALQKEGLTDAVLLAMLRSGRQEPPLQQPASPLPPASAPQYDQYDQREPNVVVVGHGPDRPNAGDVYYYGAAPYAVPYLVPVPYPVLVRAQRSHRGVRQIDVPLTPGLLTPNSIPPSQPDMTAPPATGIFFATPARGIFFDR